jgi:hypothetical protein
MADTKPESVDQIADRYLCEPLEQRLMSMSDLIRSAQWGTRMNEHALALEYVRVIERVLEVTAKEVRALRETMEAAER